MSGQFRYGTQTTIIPSWWDPDQRKPNKHRFWSPYQVTIVFKTLYIYVCNLYYTYVNVYTLCRGCNFWQILLKFGTHIPFCKSLDKCFSQNNPIIREFTPVWGCGRGFPDNQVSNHQPKKTAIYLLQYDTTYFYFTPILWFSCSSGSIFVKIIFFRLVTVCRVSLFHIRFVRYPFWSTFAHVRLIC